MTKDEYLVTFDAAYERGDLAEVVRLSMEPLLVVIDELSEEEMDRVSSRAQYAELVLSGRALAAERRENTA